jgi:TatD DNase family protein
LIDSHCHLTAKQFNEDRHETIMRALESGVTTMVCIGDTFKSAEDAQRLSKKYSEIYFTAGIHPHHAEDWIESSANTLKKYASDPRCKAIGEIGLDYFYMHQPKNVQIEACKAQMLLAQELGLPIVLHCREAVTDLSKLIAETNTIHGVIHCCSETWADVTPLVERGLHLSFTGIATFPKSDVIRDTIKQCPLDRMMIETDSPYLAPVPYRGKRNEPAYVVEVAKCLAEVKGLSLEDVITLTTENAERFFNLK